MEKNELTVGDLYCGAGGFSEGFRQAGFRVLWGLDNWKPAQTTFEENLGAPVVKERIEDVDFAKLPKVDVLIGSPPCQPFSLANKGGGGDVAKGLRLVEKFIEAVKTICPKYWIMENVANMRPSLTRAWQIDRNHFTKKDITQLFPQMEVLDCSVYGVPQRRKRLFSGSFPMSLRNDRPEIPMRKVINALRYPMEDVKEHEGLNITDPVYGFELKASELTDHFHLDTSLDERSWRMAEQEKTRHRWAGHMKFPDDLALPSRTICATSQTSGRQTIVIEDSRSRKGVVYRTPTIRESASLQGFPITYQFYAASLADKQTLVGNAVPPPIARALALSIREDMRLPYHDTPSFRLPTNPAPDITSTPKKHHHRFPENRPCRRSISGLPADCRVELDNGGEPGVLPWGKGRHLKGWRVALYLGYAREYAAFELDLPTALRLSRAVLESRPIIDPQAIFSIIFSDSIAQFEGKVPDATSLQEIWTGRLGLANGPDWILSTVESICEKVVGKPDLKTGIKAREFASIFEKKIFDGGKDKDKGEWRNQPVDAFTACAALSLAIATVFINKGSSWAVQNWDRRYYASNQSPSRPDVDDKSDKSLLANYLTAR